MHTEIVSTLSLGFLLGLKHALDADHLVAVSTLVSERRGVFRSGIVGAWWGLGHTLALLVVGIVVIALRVQIPERIAQGMEFVVALMLVFLGINVLRKLQGGTLHMHAHKHSLLLHVHPHIHNHEHDDKLEEFHHTRSHFFGRLKSLITNGKGSLLIGMVHGLAGSAALMLIVLTTIPTTTLALGYILIFGFGSLGGMFLMSTLIGLPFVFIAQDVGELHRLIRGIAGSVSVAFGMFLAWQVGIVEGLFIR